MIVYHQFSGIFINSILQAKPSQGRNIFFTEYKLVIYYTYAIHLFLLIFPGGWHSVGEVPANEQSIFKVTDLIHKKEYKFRIRAENKLGSSEPNIFGKPILAKDPWGKFNIIIIIGL